MNVNQEEYCKGFTPIVDQVMKDLVFRRYQEDFLINSNACCSTLHDIESFEEDEKVWAKSEDIKQEVHDPLEEINLGSDENPRVTYISKLLTNQEKQEIIKILKEFKDCFAWEHHEMPGIDRQIIEHKLPIKDGFKPVAQSPRRLAPELVQPIQEEINKLLKAKFIRPCQYADWISNIVPVIKKNGQIRICIDFRDLNKATPKDQYPMPVADLLIDAASRYEYISSMDGYAGYHQLRIAHEDCNKTAFRCPKSLGLYEYVAMPFGLKNAGATYQRAMDSIFKDMIGKIMEVYIDDILVKSNDFSGHKEHLIKSFTRMREYHLKMNPLKCAFGVKASNFLGFLIHKNGMEIDQNKAKAVLAAKPPSNKKELQRFLGQVNYVRRFMANLAGKTKKFSPLLRLKHESEFEWKEEHQAAFDQIKQDLANPPVLIPPRQNGKPLRLYLSACEDSIGSLLTQENEKGHEQAIFYLSRILHDTEKRYTMAEKWCLCLYDTSVKLIHYFMAFTIEVVSPTDVIKYMISQPFIKGRLSKWSLHLLQFDLIYVPQKAVKGQALADFLATHPCCDSGIIDNDVLPWTLFFDGSSTRETSGAGIYILSPARIPTKLAVTLKGPCTNNRAEYEALIIGMEMLVELGAKKVRIYGDSQLVICQMNGEFKSISSVSQECGVMAQKLSKQFKEVTFVHIPREENRMADQLSQIASARENMPSEDEDIILKEKVLEPLRETGEAESEEMLEVCKISILREEKDWRDEIIQYLQNPTGTKVPNRVKLAATKYYMQFGELHRKDPEGLLLKCVDAGEALTLMAEIHQGICGAHQNGLKMRWLLHEHGYYWPTMRKDCINYAKGCKGCQKFGPISRAPASELKYILKPWPFRGWAVDAIGEINPASSKKHSYILVITDYFTKWVEAQAFTKINTQTVISFLEEKIFTRFGIPETITFDQATVFKNPELLDYLNQFGITKLHSTPYYAQANGQAEATNKIIVKGISKLVDNNPRNWDELLLYALWAYRTSKREATGVTPFNLVYGHTPVIPAELNVKSSRVAQQMGLSGDDYSQAMNIEIMDASEAKEEALAKMQAQKERVARAYNKKVVLKEFQEDDKVWKMFLPEAAYKDYRLGKWSPKWQGPFIIHKKMSGNAYILKNIDGTIKDRAINGKFLKKYYPSIWEQHDPVFQQKHAELFQTSRDY